MGELSVVSVGFLGGLFTVATVVAAGVWLLRRAGRQRLSWVVLPLAVVLGAAAVGDAVNAYFSYLPHLGDAVGVLQGGSGDWHPVSLRHVAVPAAATAAERARGGVATLQVPDLGSGFGRTSALVYLPPQYFTEPARRFPVLYLMHGSPGVPADWLRGGKADQAGLRAARTGDPMILAIPRMSHGWLDDPECVDGVHENVETHFVRDVVPAVDSGLRTVPDRAARGVGGMSAGGYCALNLGLRHRDLLSVVLDMSGLTEPTHAGGTSALFGSGPTAAQALLANSPGRYVASLADGPPIALWLDAGRDDHEVLPELQRITPVLQSQPAVEAELHLRNGAHTFHVWAPALRDSLAWAGTRFARATVAAMPAGSGQAQ